MRWLLGAVLLVAQMPPPPIPTTPLCRYPQPALNRIQIREQWRIDNKEYFNGQLPDLPLMNIQYADMEDNLAVTFVDKRGNVRLTINSRIAWSDRIVKWLILHEMAHVSVKDYLLPAAEQHGEKWQAEMRRLYRSGAFQDLW